MTDIFSVRKRSEIMSRIRSTGTKPEDKLLELVRHALGCRWNVEQHVQDLPGQPDIVIRGLRLVMFADGCFYHSCPRHGHQPKSNRGYWTPKLNRNKRRDAAYERKLRRMGFGVWRFWEHALRGGRVDATYRVLERRLERRVAAPVRRRGRRSAY